MPFAPAVSILVVLELATRLQLLHQLPAPCDVSILVVLELATRHHHHRSGAYIGSVSILVVLELATRQPCAGSRRSKSWRFNPCCAGTGYPALSPPRMHQWIPCFNPCCAGTGYPASGKTLGTGVTTTVDTMFQSLLCWNWLPGWGSENSERAKCGVSILVVLELATRLLDAAHVGTVVLVSILVVLELATRPRTRFPPT